MGCGDSTRDVCVADAVAVCVCVAMCVWLCVCGCVTVAAHRDGAAATLTTVCVHGSLAPQDATISHQHPVDFMVMEPHASVIAAAHQSTTLHAYLGHAPWASSPLLVRAIAAVVEYMSVELMEQVLGISCCTVRTNSHVMWRVCVVRASASSGAAVGGTCRCTVGESLPSICGSRARGDGF